MIPPHDLTLTQALFIIAVWSVLAIGGGAWIGVSCSEVDCGTCEEALGVAIEKRQACEKELLTNLPDKCEDELRLERERCELTLENYKALRCRICEASHDTYPPQPVHNPHTAPSAQ